MFKSLVLIDDKYGTVWIHDTEEDFKAGKPPLTEYRIKANAEGDKSLSDMLIEKMAKTDAHSQDAIYKNREISTEEFYLRFTIAELASFQRASLEDDNIAALLMRVFTRRDNIQLDSIETIDSLNYLVATGKLAKNRPEEIRDVIFVAD